MADDFLSVLEKAMKSKEPGGGVAKTATGRTSSDNDTPSQTINPTSGPTYIPPDVDGGPRP